MRVGFLSHQPQNHKQSRVLNQNIFIEYPLSVSMVDFRQRQNKLRAVDTESNSMSKSMKMQFVNQDTAVFINPITGRTEEVQTDDIPTQFLERELSLHKERAKNTGTEEIKKKVDKIESILDDR